MVWVAVMVGLFIAVLALGIGAIAAILAVHFWRRDD
jgi:hypothetical protein